MSVLLCFAFATGIASSDTICVLARQIPAEMSAALGACDNIVTSFRTFTRFDANSIDNITLFALPPDSIVKKTCIELDADYALTGRIVEQNNGYVLGVNVLDIHSNVLAFSTVRECRAIDLIVSLNDIASEISLKVFNHDSDIVAQRNKCLSVTQSENYYAFTHWFAIRELERNRNVPDIDTGRRIIDLAVDALELDPDFDRMYESVLRELTLQNRCELFEHTFEKFKDFDSKKALPAQILLLCATKIDNCDLDVVEQFAEKFPEDFHVNALAAHLIEKSDCEKALAYKNKAVSLRNETLFRDFVSAIR